MFEREFNIGRLISAQLQGTITAQEQSELQAWIAESEINLKRYEEFVNEGFLNAKLNKYHQADSQAMFHHIEKGMANMDNAGGHGISRAKIVHLWRRIMVVAAVALIVLSVYFFRTPDAAVTKANLEFANDVAPGKIGATLTLADGRKIRLSDAANGELANEAGVVITKTADGQVKYELNGKGLERINIMSTGNGETYMLTLADGSKVWLNAASSITYSSGLLKNGRRSVQLSGEAYFEVAKDIRHPFIVESRGQEVAVLGTHFNVNAYQNEAFVRTTLAEGQVLVRKTGKTNPVEGEDFVLLKPGQQSQLASDAITVRSVDVLQFTSWKDGYFRFEENTVEEVMTIIARWYDLDVDYQHTPGNDRYTGIISRFVKISELLAMLERTKTVRFKVQGRRVTVMN